MLAGALDTHLERRHAESGHFGHVFVGQILGILQDDCFAMFRVESSQRGRQIGGKISATILVFVAGGKIGNRVEADRRISCAAFAREHRSAFVDENLHEPRPELAAFLIPIEEPVGAYERVLRGVLRIGAIAEHAHREANAPTIMPIDEDAVRVDVTVTHPPHDLGVGRLHRRVNWDGAGNGHEFVFQYEFVTILGLCFVQRAYIEFGARHVRTTPFLLAVCVTLAACDSATRLPNAPSSLRVQIAKAELSAGMETSVAVIADGQSVPVSDVEWVSRDPSVATVSGGVVRAGGAGTAQVVARYAGATDSSGVLVHFGTLGPGGASLRVSSVTPTDGNKLAGVAASMHIVSNDQYFSLIAASNKGGGPTRNGFTVVGDSLLEITFTKKMAVGTLMLDPPVTSSVAPFFSGPGVRLLAPSPTLGQLAIYVPVRPARLEITSLEYPRAAGYRPGLVKGYVSFEAAGFNYTFTPTAQLTPIGNRTVMVFAEFSSPLYEYPLVETGVFLTGTPFAGAGAVAGPAIVEADGRLSVRVGGILLPTVADPRRGFAAELSIGRAALGTFDVRARLAIAPPSTGGDSLVATQTRGSATVTAYTPATDDDYGEIRGTLDVVLGYSQAGYSGGLTSTFRIPVAPLKAPPPVIVPR
jgi:hypothetical protein